MTALYDFTDRRVLITGASRGIAAAIALALGRCGATVGVNFAAQVDADAGFGGEAEKLAKAIDDTGGRAVLLEGDLGQPGAGTRLIADAEAAMGPLDGLVLSASIQVNKRLHQQTSEEVERQLRLNILTNIEMLQAALPAMAERGFGRVLGIGSVQDVAPNADMAVYAMTKAAQKNLIEALAVEYAEAGVTLNTLSPGLIATDRNGFRRANPDGWNIAQSSANPMRRAGTPDEMADPALYLLSREAAFTTGTTIYASGGAHIPAPGRAIRLVLEERQARQQGADNAPTEPRTEEIE